MTQCRLLLNTIKEGVSEGFEAMNQVIHSQLTSNVPFVEKLLNEFLSSGGKRLRPLLVLLVAKSCGYQGTAHHQLAAIIELLHTATLIHDDVIDESSLRRHKKTVHELYGQSLGVLAGDFLFSRAFQMMTGLGSPIVYESLATVTNIMAEGEILQLCQRGIVDVEIEQYEEVLFRKTAVLFGTACFLGAHVTEMVSEETCQLFRTFGNHLGMAFQIIDDVLDYSGEEKRWGKALGDDLAEGKITLPLIYTLAYATPKDQDIIKHAIAGRDGSDIMTIFKIVESSPAIELCDRRAREHLRLAYDALSILSEVSVDPSLFDLAEYCVVRHN